MITHSYPVPRRKPPRWLGVLLFPFGLVVGAILLAVMGPMIAYVVVRGTWDEWRGRRRLRREGRLLSLTAARQRLDAEGGILLVALGPKGLGGGCWVPTDAIGADCPLPDDRPRPGRLLARVARVRSAGRAGVVREPAARAGRSRLARPASEGRVGTVRRSDRAQRPRGNYYLWPDPITEHRVATHDMDGDDLPLRGGA
jgi:hypothetical protein